MNFEIVKVIASGVKTYVRNNSTTILTAIGSLGVVTTAYFTYRGTVAAMQELDDEVKTRMDTAANETGVVITSYPKGKDSFTPMEIVKYTWKCYMPALASGLLTISAIVGSNHISLRRNAALASVFAITERAVKEYEAKVVETLGEKKAEKIKEEIAQDRINKKPLSQNTVVRTGRGETLMFDAMSGRYFYHDLEKIRKVENDFNKEIISNGMRTLNEFYIAIGLEPVSMGELLGWGSDFGFLEIDYRPKLADNDQPCISLEYKVEPATY